MGWLDHERPRLQLPALRPRRRARRRAGREARRAAGAPRRGRRALRASAWPRSRACEVPLAGRGRERRSWFVYVVRLADGVDRDATIAGLGRARHRQQGLPALHPPLPAPARARLPRGPVPGRRSRRRALAGAALLPGDERGRRWSASARSWRRHYDRAADGAASAKIPTRASGALNRSLPFDWQLAPYDIDQSRAHARGLRGIGVLDAEELGEIDAGLERVRAADGRARLRVRGRRRGHPHGDRAPARRGDRPAGRQAPHRPLAQRPGRHRRGDGGPGPLAAGRSSSARAAMERLLALAEAHRDWPMPGYTHLQRAQPVYLGHHLLAYFWMLARDVAALPVRARQRQRDAARLRRPGRGQLGDRPRRRRRRPRLRARHATTRSTAPPTATSSSTTWPPPRPARCTSRAWARNS